MAVGIPIRPCGLKVFFHKSSQKQVALTSFYCAGQEIRSKIFLSISTICHLQAEQETFLHVSSGHIVLSC